MEVVFNLSKKDLVVLDSTGADLQIFKSKFSLFPFISVLFWMVIVQMWWAAGESETKANSAQLSWDWG